MPRWTAVVSLLLFCVVLCAAPARADVRDEARELAREGIEMLEQGRHREALDKLEQAEQKFHAPTHLVYIARALTALGRLVEAHERYVEVLIEDIPNYAPPAFHEARATAERGAAELLPRVAALRVGIRGADDAEARLDGRALSTARLAHPIAVEPGRHRLEASAPGGASAAQEVEARRGTVTEVSLELRAPDATPAESAPSPSPAPAEEQASAFPIGAGVALGIGGAALVAGIVTGVLTLQQADEIKERCTENQCPPEEEPNADDAKLLGNVSTAMFAVAGAGVALGAVLLIVGAADDEQARGRTRVQAEIGPTGLRLRGSF